MQSRNAARIFGADRIASHASVAAGELVLVDRNCHKAIYHGLTLTGSRPVYLVSTRRLRADGPDPAGRGGPRRRHRDAVRVTELLGASVPRLHLDEARFAYAREFHAGI
ncbi:MAG TPA: hypothetical protein VGR06_05595 [Actinophytocola sp.]|uniref:hypothetical protein n=1 Tax=Actinophytocola sp. TaxID=1872138 RepID=UPI002DFC1EFA|nr:hypothetical protein [Actinophytocola sp.]